MPPSNSPVAGPGDPGAYVVRSTDRARDGRVTYTVVDMAGRISKVTIPRALTLTELADPVIRHHVERNARRVGR